MPWSLSAFCFYCYRNLTIKIRYTFILVKKSYLTKSALRWNFQDLSSATPVSEIYSERITPEAVVVSEKWWRCYGRSKLGNDSINCARKVVMLWIFSPCLPLVWAITTLSLERNRSGTDDCFCGSREREANYTLRIPEVPRLSTWQR